MNIPAIQAEIKQCYRRTGFHNEAGITDMGIGVMVLHALFADDHRKVYPMRRHPRGPHPYVQLDWKTDPVGQPLDVVRLSCSYDGTPPFTWFDCIWTDVPSALAWLEISVRTFRERCDTETVC